MKGKIIILSGPSGSGKTTIQMKLLAANRTLKKSISCTTRSRREGERHGRDYFFVSLKNFLYKKRSGHFLETQKVYRNYYGTPLKNVRDIIRRGDHALLCIDVKGAKTVMRKFPGALRIFVKTRSLAILQNRLLKRASDDRKSVNLRMEVAKRELNEAKNYDYVVINGNLQTAMRKIQKILNKELNI